MLLFAVFDAVRLAAERWPSRVPAITPSPIRRGIQDNFAQHSPRFQSGPSCKAILRRVATSAFGICFSELSLLNQSRLDLRYPPLSLMQRLCGCMHGMRTKDEIVAMRD